MELVFESVIPASVAEVFAFHENAGAFAALLPPWERTEIIRGPTSLEVGTVVVVRTKVGPMWLTIEAEHVEYEKNRVFTDVMRRGPFPRWRHRHVFLEDPQGCRLRDEIDYAVPGGPLAGLVDRWLVRPRLRRMFEYRHEATRRGVRALLGTNSPSDAELRREGKARGEQRSGPA
jgi:ligand-binding SRPBCC domain-containing protein